MFFILLLIHAAADAFGLEYKHERSRTRVRYLETHKQYVRRDF